MRAGAGAVRLAMRIANHPQATAIPPPFLREEEHEKPATSVQGTSCRVALAGAALALAVAAGLQAAPALAAASGTWTATGSMSTTGRYDTATLLPGGQVLVTGGFNYNHKKAALLASAELYTP
jgi:capsular polysaccharide biosynthesis protein